MGKSKELAELGQVVTQSGGNVGIGVEPEDWYPAFDALQIGQSTAIWSQNNYDKMWLTTNTYLGADGEFKHINNAPVTAYAQFDGTHRWSYADGGASGSNATLSEYMRIDASGRVTMPYQPFFKARSQSNVNISVGSQTLPFDVVDTNIGGYYNGTTSTFTAPVSGRYVFNVMIFRPPSTTSWSYFVLNGTRQTSIEYNDTGSNYSNRSDTFVAYLAAGDYVYMMHWSGTTHLNGTFAGPHSYFSGYLIG